MTAKRTRKPNHDWVDEEWLAAFRKKSEDTAVMLARNALVKALAEGVPYPVDAAIREVLCFCWDLDLAEWAATEAEIAIGRKPPRKTALSK